MRSSTPGAGRPAAREEVRLPGQAPPMVGGVEEHGVAGQLGHPVPLGEVDAQPIVGAVQQRRRGIGAAP